MLLFTQIAQEPYQSTFSHDSLKTDSYSAQIEGLMLASWLIDIYNIYFEYVRLKMHVLVARNTTCNVTRTL